MGNEIIKQDKQELVPVQVTAQDIKNLFCPLATEKEVLIALGIIKSFGLNPFKREVHIIKYGNSPAQIVVGYETYLKRAERTGKLDGWKCELSDDKKQAKVTIYRKDWKEPFVWEADREEFDKKQSTWNQMKNFMLKKICISQAFRICFADEMGGLPYTQEEQELINNNEPNPEPAIIKKHISAGELTKPVDVKPVEPGKEVIQPEETKQAMPDPMLSAHEYVKEIFEPVDTSRGEQQQNETRAALLKIYPTSDSPDFEKEQQKLRVKLGKAILKSTGIDKAVQDMTADEYARFSKELWRAAGEWGIEI